MIELSVTPNVCPVCLDMGTRTEVIGDKCLLCGHKFLLPSVVRIADTQTRAQKLAQGVKDALMDNDIIGPSRTKMETLLNDFDDGPPLTLDYFKIQKYILEFDPAVMSPHTRDVLDALLRLAHNT